VFDEDSGLGFSEPSEISKIKPFGLPITQVTGRPERTVITFRAYNNATSMSVNSSEPGYGEALVDSYYEISDPEFNKFKLTLNFETPVILT
jgi:hypothetical protein